MCVFSERGEKMRHSKTVRNSRNQRERQGKKEKRKIYSEWGMRGSGGENAKEKSQKK